MTANDELSAHRAELADLVVGIMRTRLPKEGKTEDWHPLSMAAVPAFPVPELFLWHDYWADWDSAIWTWDGEMQRRLALS